MPRQKCEKKTFNIYEYSLCLRCSRATPTNRLVAAQDANTEKPVNRDKDTHNDSTTALSPKEGLPGNVLDRLWTKGEKAAGGLKTAARSLKGRSSGKLESEDTRGLSKGAKTAYGQPHCALFHKSSQSGDINSAEQWARGYKTLIGPHPLEFDDEVMTTWSGVMAEALAPISENHETVKETIPFREIHHHTLTKKRNRVQHGEVALPHSHIESEAFRIAQKRLTEIHNEGLTEKARLSKEAALARIRAPRSLGRSSTDRPRNVEYVGQQRARADTFPRLPDTDSLRIADARLARTRDGRGVDLTYGIRR
ncbi:uncharacterized protein BP5553_03553 [Venustampulla echinocandica]|uniref:Uncharacterized protein n=1 Tax=Venustampulla echinocandica TaxID=2656787 RepID=A0A370TUK5_9HELO|nr:uncharacterized protein BP5553_03553 [Venustampulla echinocandica]RDL39213.1 hypothetical protein BP5553_03553 [Venustampulla echinocandica]